MYVSLLENKIIIGGRLSYQRANDIGAKCKVNYRTSVLIELYAFNGHYNTMTFGFRSDMKRGSISYGELSTTSNEFFELEGAPFPYIGFTLGFY